MSNGKFTHISEIKRHDPESKRYSITLFGFERYVHGSLELEDLLGKRKVAGSISAHGVDFWMRNAQVDFPFDISSGSLCYFKLNVG